MAVRVRFAPSPTGYLHIGAARSALFNWLFARQTGGKFLLRIEDTDLQRSTEESTRSIIEGLGWLGLDYDEEMVFQSNNAEKHRAAARRLVAEGKAYRDFSPRAEREDKSIKEEIAERDRGQAAEGLNHRNNPYPDLSKHESDRRSAAGEAFAIRLKVPVEGESRFADIVYGDQDRSHSEIEDLVLLRSDGHPLYNLSVVLDDIEMGITHVIRGQDHLTNTHKQILLYQAFGAEIPQFAHLPLILAPNKAKLSKRKHGEVVSLTTYRDRGFVPAAFRNFLALLGWSPDATQHAAEITVGNFSMQGRAYFSEDFDFDEAAVRKNILKEPKLKELLPALADRLNTIEPLNAAQAEAALRIFSDEVAVKAGLLINASRTMLTGQAV